MRGEDDVVEGDGGRVAAVAGGVLGADDGAVVEGAVGGEVGEEAQAVDEREVDGGARGGLAGEVEEGLRVEGGGPASRVDPAEEAGEDGEEADDHFCYILAAICEVRKMKDSHVEN